MNEKYMTFFPTEEKARELAEYLTKTDEGWVYKARVFENGTAVVEAYDEDGKYISSM